MPSTLSWVLGGARRQTLALLLSVPPESSCDQTEPGEHHPAWVAGHLLAGDLYLLHLLGEAELPDDFGLLVERYGPGAVPVPDLTRYEPFARVVERLTESGRRRVAAVSKATAADLDRALPDARMATAQPTVRHHLHAIVFHEGYHTGQVAAWSRRRRIPPAEWAFSPRAGGAADG